jgi:tetratricopeptide (TPR) repeat protein
VLLEKMLDRYASEIKDSAELHYYHGIIALCRGDYGTAESRFEASINSDASFFYRINKKRNEIADYYHKLAIAESTLKDFGPAIVELLLLKGLKCNPDHAVINKEFRQFAEDDLAKIKIESGSSKQLLKKWIDLFDREGDLLSCLEKDTIYSFYFSYGKILKGEEKYQKALKNFHKLLLILPDNPEVHINMADIYFAIKDFDSGLQSLKTAVGLDKKYAVYWYNMGKNLQSQNDYNGAVLAYEQYFIALPEKIAVLKDIGDCHAKLGNLDAAREAYQQLKNLSSGK